MSQSDFVHFELNELINAGIFRNHRHKCFVECDSLSSDKQCLLILESEVSQEQKVSRCTDTFNIALGTEESSADGYGIAIKR